LWLGLGLLSLCRLQRRWGNGLRLSRHGRWSRLRLLHRSRRRRRYHVCLCRNGRGHHMLSRAGAAAGARVAFAAALGFFADFSFSGVPVGAGVAVAPCVAAGVAQDCHGQHIALAGSVISINADTAKGTVNFAFIEPLPFTVVAQLASPR
jgi:hypothetical protein